MKNYEKPVVIPNAETAEGVFTASGDDCFTASAVIEYRPDDPYSAGRYSIRLSAQHDADHYSAKRRYIIVFNQSVTFFEQQGGGVVNGPDSGTTLTIDFDSSQYFVRPKDGPGDGYLKVYSDPGLAVVSVKCIDLEKSDVPEQR